jgi:hypothetical protein
MRVKIQVFLQLEQQNPVFSRHLEGFRPEKALAKGKSGVMVANRALMRTLPPIQNATSGPRPRREF